MFMYDRLVANHGTGSEFDLFPQAPAISTHDDHAPIELAHHIMQGACMAQRDGDFGLHHQTVTDLLKHGARVSQKLHSSLPDGNNVHGGPCVDRVACVVPWLSVDKNCSKNPMDLGVHDHREGDLDVPQPIRTSSQGSNYELIRNNSENEKHISDLR